MAVRSMRKEWLWSASWERTPTQSEVRDILKWLPCGLFSTSTGYVSFLSPSSRESAAGLMCAPEVRGQHPNFHWLPMYGLQTGSEDSSSTGFHVSSMKTCRTIIQNQWHHQNLLLLSAQQLWSDFSQRRFVLGSVFTQWFCSNISRLYLNVEGFKRAL